MPRRASLSSRGAVTPTTEERRHACACSSSSATYPKSARSSANSSGKRHKKSNEVLRQLAPDIQWQHSYVAGGKTFCVYLANGEDVIRKHAEISGFPATTITAIKRTIDPTTASV